jgi:hypothetical protein
MTIAIGASENAAIRKRTPRSRLATKNKDAEVEVGDEECIAERERGEYDEGR